MKSDFVIDDDDIEESSKPKQQGDLEDGGEGGTCSFSADVHSLPSVAEITGKRNNSKKEKVANKPPQQQHDDDEEEGNSSSFGANVHSLPSVADVTGKRSEEDGFEFEDNCSFSGDEDDDDHLCGSSKYDCASFFFVCILVNCLAIGLSVGLTQKQAYSKQLELDMLYRDVVVHVVNYRLSDENDVLTEDSPQFRAATYMAHQQNVPVPVGMSPATAEGYSFAAKYALAVLYFSTRGDQWTEGLNFLSEDRHYCDWFQIVRAPGDAAQAVPRGVGCNSLINNDAGTTTVEIDTLFLDHNNLQGSLPTELGILTTLRVLNMQANSLTGSIPDKLLLFQLKHAEHISLSHNSLTGTFPEWITVNAPLRSLDLSYNMLTGELPSDLGLLGTSLRGLALDHNLFHGPLDPIFQTVLQESIDDPYHDQVGLTGLYLLYLDDNFFDGTIDDEYMRTMTNLRRLDISGNQLDGTIPNHFFRFAHLEVLDLHNNRNITGRLPVISPIKSLLYLALHRNNLVGPIPRSIQYMNQLQHLDLSDNQLSSSLPSAIGLLSDLQYLFLGNNPLDEGPVPSFLTELTNLQELSLKSTQRTGSLPTNIFTHDVLSRLILLDLDNNRLQGTIPSSMATMRNLEFLLLNKNRFVGTIPNEFRGLISLRLLLVDGNELEGTMDIFCVRPSDYYTPYIAADCGGSGTSVAEIECDCCFLCCTDDQPCDDNSIVPSFNPMWQFDYQRVFYQFDNNDLVMMYSNNNNGT